jgi:hypothetical protein
MTDLATKYKVPAEVVAYVPFLLLPLMAQGF